MNKIFIICSKAFYKDIPPIKEKLEENGWDVFLPHTYENPNAEYVGGSTFLELYEAFMENKKIYLWNEIPEGILFDEISGFAPEIINGNLDLVK